MSCTCPHVPGGQCGKPPRQRTDRQRAAYAKRAREYYHRKKTNGQSRHKDSRKQPLAQREDTAAVRCAELAAALTRQESQHHTEISALRANLSAARYNEGRDRSAQTPRRVPFTLHRVGLGRVAAHSSILPTAGTDNVQHVVCEHRQRAGCAQQEEEERVEEGARRGERQPCGGSWRRSWRW